MTETISPTPEPPRPQPGSDPSGPQQRFRLPGSPAGATRPAAARPVTTPRGLGAGGANRPGGPGAAAQGGSRFNTTTPEGRYGDRPGISRPRRLTLGIAGIAILGAVGGYIGWEMAHPPIQGTVTGFNASTTSVVVTFEVDKAADKSATCTLSAVDVHGALVGTASVPIVAGRAKNVQTYTLQTTNTANTVTVQSCKLTN